MAESGARRSLLPCWWHFAAILPVALLLALILVTSDWASHVTTLPSAVVVVLTLAILFEALFHGPPGSGYLGLCLAIYLALSFVWLVVHLLGVVVLRRRLKNLEALGGALRAAFTTNPPTSTWIGVSLAVPDFLIEIEATAASE